MESLHTKIEKIVNEAINLKNKYLKDVESQIDYVCIYAQSAEEYDFYSEAALKLGDLLKENERGIYVIPENKINTSEGLINFIKVRKPDSNRLELGDVDFVVDFEYVKSLAQNSNNFSITKSSDGVELIRLQDEDFNVLVHFPQIPLSSDYLDNNKNEDKSKENVETEKQKRVQLMADFENYKKRVEQERATFGAIANMSLIADLLEVSDDLNLALQDEKLTLERSKESIKIAIDKLVGAAKKSGVEKLDINVGDNFDSSIMEAVTTIPDEKNKGKVVAVISSAFKMVANNTIIRAAKVIVGK